MPGEHLHAFDMELCDYAVGQFRSHLRTLRERPRPPFPALDYDAFHRQTPAEWLGRGVAGLPEPLADHVWAGVTGEPVVMCLNDAELTALAGLADDPPLRCEGDCVWVPAPALHQGYVQCLVDIRSELSQVTAEMWASESVAFAARLSEDELPLVHGFDAVHEWLWSLRHLLASMKAARWLPDPLGDLPTPTAAGVAVVPDDLGCTHERFLEVLAKVRQAISESPDGKNTKADAVIARVRRRPQLVRRILRWLQARGEYSGHAKDKPACYSRKD
jgi:hypothetical protein